MRNYLSYKNPDNFIVTTDVIKKIIQASGNTI